MPKAARPGGGGHTAARPQNEPATRPAADPWAGEPNPSDDGWPADVGTAQVPGVAELMKPATETYTDADGVQVQVDADGNHTEVDEDREAVALATGGDPGPSTPAGPSEAAGGAPVTQETPPDARDGVDRSNDGDSEPEVVAGFQVVGVSPEEMVTEETPPAKATKKAPAKRAKPTPVVAAHQGEMAGPTPTGLQLASLDDGEELVNAVWYGPEGTGKTTDVCTAANHGRILVINAEGGLKTTPLRRRGIKTENISIFPPAGRPELLTVDNLERLFWQIQAELHDDPAAWYAVVWDSVTEIVNKLLRDIVEREVAKNNALPEGSARRKEHRETTDVTDRSDYGVVSNQMLPLLRKYRDLPCHFLMTALERRDVDEDSGRVMYGPNTTPAVQSALLGYADIAMRVQNAAGENDLEPHFVARTRPARNTRAKDRFGVTPPVMEDPTFDRVLAYLNGELVYEPPAEEPVEPQPASKPPAKKATAKKAAPRTATTDKEH